MDELLSDEEEAEVALITRRECRREGTNEYETQKQVTRAIREAQVTKLKAMGYEQVWEECPDCEHGIVQNWHKVGMDTMCSTEEDCPTCKGTGRKRKLVEWDKDKVIIPRELASTILASFAGLRIAKPTKWYSQQDRVFDQLKEILTGE